MFMCLKVCLEAVLSDFYSFIHIVCVSFLCFGFLVVCRSRSSGLDLHSYTQIQ